LGLNFAFGNVGAFAMFSFGICVRAFALLFIWFFLAGLFWNLLLFCGGAYWGVIFLFSFPLFWGVTEPGNGNEKSFSNESGRKKVEKCLPSLFRPFQNL